MSKISIPKISIPKIFLTIPKISKIFLSIPKISIPKIFLSIPKKEKKDTQKNMSLPAQPSPPPLTDRWATPVGPFFLLPLPPIAATSLSPLRPSVRELSLPLAARTTQRTATWRTATRR